LLGCTLVQYDVHIVSDVPLASHPLSAIIAIVEWQ